MRTARELIAELEAAGISQVSLSIATGVSQPTISRIARGVNLSDENVYRVLYGIHLRVSARESVTA
jgi:transcriptional regulator with XRE-family HTH domain